MLPEQCRDRAVGTLRQDKRAIATAIQITDEAQNRNMTAPDSISGEGETDRRWFTVYHGPTRSEERRVGKECVRQCRSRGAAYHSTQKKSHSSCTIRSMKWSYKN